jgi:4-alpha-glucanotransferase
VNARRAGILLHPTSLPGPLPFGTLGRAADDFVDSLADAGCTLWQVLPLHPPGRELSPYDTRGTRVTSPHLVDLDRLVEDGFLEREEVAVPDGTDTLTTWHQPLVRRAATRIPSADLELYAREHPAARDWALLCALLDAHGVDSWRALPPLLRDRDPRAIADASERLEGACAVHLGAQLLASHQWARVRAHAARRGVLVVGDLPLFVSPDAVDAWVDRELFCWSPDLDPDPETGAPPDYFDARGQCWATPHYDWPKHEATGFRWWCDRLAASLAHADVVRVDHFRGLAAAWAIPHSARGDARLGAWRPSPGAALLEALRADHPELPLIAEDLGHITDDVTALRERFAIPGMKVLQFAFGPEHDNPHLPRNWSGDRFVVYTGTHDNDTALGWYRSLDEETRRRFHDATGSGGSDPAWDLVSFAWRSPARWAVAPLQDVLGLGSEARTNKPGTSTGNWRWQASIPNGAFDRLAALTAETGRSGRSALG